MSRGSNVPHFTIEYSANLDERIDMNALCETILRAALATDYFEVGAVRVRAKRCDSYAIADALPANAFIDIRLRLGAGRSARDKKTIGQAIFDAVTDHLFTLFETPHFALSFDISEIDPDLSWKKNAMHPRLRNK